MNIIVFIKLVPDLVEELSIDESGKALDDSWLRLIINEFDDHSLEQAILIKERAGANITIITLDIEGVDGVLFTAAAKGADQLIKLTGSEEIFSNNHLLARSISSFIQTLEPDLVLTGVQANNDIDGPIGPLLAEFLGMPYDGYISSVETKNNTVHIQKEYPGGLNAFMEVSLPAVLGIQAAEQPPRYVAVSKVRQMMNTATIEEHSLEMPDVSGGPVVQKMYLPEVSERATMIEGDEEQIAERLIEIFKEIGAL